MRLKYLQMAFMLLMLSPASGQSLRIEPIEEYRLLIDDLKNLDTYGYKGHFSMQKGLATSVSDMTQGALKSTDQTTDLGIVGSGFFKMRSPDGKVCFTRNGNFQINSRLEFVSTEGFSLFDPIKLPQAPSTIQVLPNGDFYVVDAEGKKRQISTIRLYSLPLDKIARNIGSVFYLKEDESGVEDRNVKVIQGTLEMSNVWLNGACFRLLFLVNEIDARLLKRKETKKEMILELIRFLYVRESTIKTAYYSAKIEKAISTVEDANTASKQKGPDSGATEYALGNWFLDSMLPFLEVDYE